jgi:hypothetical protein
MISSHVPPKIRIQFNILHPPIKQEPSGSGTWTKKHLLYVWSIWVLFFLTIWASYTKYKTYLSAFFSYSFPLHLDSALLKLNWWGDWIHVNKKDSVSWKPSTPSGCASSSVFQSLGIAFPWECHFTQARRVLLPSVPFGPFTNMFTTQIIHKTQLSSLLQIWRWQLYILRMSQRLLCKAPQNTVSDRSIRVLAQGAHFRITSWNSSSDR